MTYCKKEKGFNSVFAKKGNPLKARFDALEFAVKKDEKAITLYAYCETSDIYGIENDDKEKPSWPAVAICRVRNEKDFPGEVMMYTILNKLDEGKVYTGFVDVQGDFSSAQKAIDKPEFLEMIEDDLIKAVEVAEPKHITSDILSMKPPSGGKRQSYTKLQLCQQRLEALQFLFDNADANSAVNEGIAALVGEELPISEKIAIITALIA